jgi:hypothetical protein
MPYGQTGQAHGSNRSTPMMDIIMLALGLSLFAATVAYAYACERL